MNVAIIGCGLIGNKRAKFLKSCHLTACVDSDIKKAESLAKLFEGCEAHTDWTKIIKRPDINIVIVATTHASLAEIGLAAITAGKHVFLEKPGGRHSKELSPMLLAAEQLGLQVRVGFNHRYHSAFRKARSLVDDRALGELMFIRGRYGHGGRLGYEKEWRADPLLSGGGELIDQGIHLIDLARWFLGDFNDVSGYAHTYFWEMPVEDNGFLLLKTPRNQVAFLHASCTEWKNLFSFEIYGRDGKIEINGLGGSYGVERLSFYKMTPEMGPPETTIWEYPMLDDSWSLEFDEFIEDIKNNRNPAANLSDAIAALQIVEKVYRTSCYDHCS